MHCIDRQIYFGLGKHIQQNIQFTDIYIYTMTMHPAPRITLTWVNPYFRYGPLCGGMTQRGKLYMKMIYKNIQLISQWIVWYCMLQKNIQNYDLKMVNRCVACKQINHS